MKAGRRCSHRGSEDVPIGAGYGELRFANAAVCRESIHLSIPCRRHNGATVKSFETVSRVGVFI